MVPEGTQGENEWETRRRNDRSPHVLVTGFHFTHFPLRLPTYLYTAIIKSMTETKPLILIPELVPDEGSPKFHRQ